MYNNAFLVVLRTFYHHQDDDKTSLRLTARKCGVSGLLKVIRDNQSLPVKIILSLSLKVNFQQEITSPFSESNLNAGNGCANNMYNPLPKFYYFVKYYHYYSKFIIFNSQHTF